MSTWKVDAGAAIHRATMVLVVRCYDDQTLGAHGRQERHSSGRRYLDSLINIELIPIIYYIYSKAMTEGAEDKRCTLVRIALLVMRFESRYGRWCVTIYKGKRTIKNGYKL